MSNEVTNGDLYSVLLGIKEDIGGLKTSADLHFEALKNHSERIGVLENSVAKQKGAVKVWGLVATGAATAVGGLLPVIFKYFRH